MCAHSSLLTEETRCGIVFWLMAIGFSVSTLWRMVDWVRRGGEPESPVFDPPLVRAAIPAPGAADQREGER